MPGEYTGEGWQGTSGLSAHRVRHGVRAFGVHTITGGLGGLGVRAATLLVVGGRLELHEGGGLPTANILDIRLLAKPDGFPAFGPAHDATRIRRLRFLNQIAVAIEEIWLDRSSGVVTAEDVSDSLYRTYQNTLGFWISRISDKVRVAPVPDWGPPAFAMQAGTPSGFVERLSWAQAEHPVEYSRTWFDPSRANYVQRIS